MSQPMIPAQAVYDELQRLYDKARADTQAAIARLQAATTGNEAHDARSEYREAMGARGALINAQSWVIAQAGGDIDLRDGTK